MFHLAVVVGNDFIRIGLPKLLIPGGEIAEVLFSLFDLYPDAAEVRLSSHETGGIIGLPESGQSSSLKEQGCLIPQTTVKEPRLFTMILRLLYVFPAKC